MRTLAKLLKALNSEQEPGQIALAICFAWVMGITPLWSLHNLVVLFLVLFLRVNLSAFLVGFGLFSAVAYAIDPLSDRLGLGILTATSLEGLWMALYNTTIGRLGAFYNTLTMGSLALTLALFVPLYLVAVRLIVEYRDRVIAWVRRTRLMQMLQTSRFYQIYSQIPSWRS